MADEQAVPSSAPIAIHNASTKHNPYSQSTLSIHADDFLNGDSITDVAPAMHVSTTYRYTNDLALLRPLRDEDVCADIFN